MAEHNYRWRYRDGRVSWTFPTREEAEAIIRNIDMRGTVLESSPDNGETWAVAKPQVVRPGVE